MKLYKSYILTCFLMLIVLHSTSAQTIELNFTNKFGQEPISLKNEYINIHGEKINFTVFDYYISNVQLTRKDGSVYRVPAETNYFLVKQSDSATHKLSIQIPKGEYAQVSYIIGVDSLRSTMGVDQRTGVLDVGAGGRGMYWRWNSGYIFFKLEGKSTASPDSLRNRFAYHIGGYGGYDKPSMNNIRRNTITFDKPLTASKKNSIQINIDVQVEKMFEGEPQLKIAAHPSVMFGPLTKQIADNYVGLFQVSHVEEVKAKR